MTEGIVGRVYLERGEPVTVLVGYRPQRKAERLDLPGLEALKAYTPRNLLIRRQDGSCVVRPFRGLRKMPAEYGLTERMCLSLDGDWVPGSLDRNPLYVATFLEYLRRGGRHEDEAAAYRTWLAEHAEIGWLAEVMGIAVELERLTLSGACVDCFGTYLDPMLDVAA